MSLTTDRQEAEATFWDADERIVAANADLADTTDPRRRSKLLTDLARAYADQAHTYTAVFGPDPLPDEDRDMAESLRLTGLLLLALADVEAAVAAPGTGLRGAGADVVEDAASAVLDQMAATTDLTARTRLLEQLHDAVVDHVGTQAADQALWLLPSPGHAGWLTVEAKYAHHARVDAAMRRQAIRRRLRWAAAVVVLVIVVAAADPFLGIAAGGAGWWFLCRRSSR